MQFANTSNAGVRKIKRQAGQGMTEYIIIVALIAVAAIGVYSMFGQTIRGQVAGLAGEVAGNKAASDGGAAQATTSSGSALTKAQQGKGMADYNGGNGAK